MAVQPLVGAKLMSTLSSRCLLAPMPFVRARLMSTLPLRCLSMPFVWALMSTPSLRCLLASDGSMAKADVNFSRFDVCIRCLGGIDANFSSFDVCL